MPMTRQEKKAHERQKQLAFNKIKKHLVEYEPYFIMDKPFGEWHYRLQFPLPEKYITRHYDKMSYVWLYIDKDCLRFNFLPAMSVYKMLDDAPNLSQYFRRNKIFKFYHTKEVDEKELKKLLKKGFAYFQESHWLK